MTHYTDLAILAKKLRLPAMAIHWQILQEKAEKEQWTYSQYLVEMLQVEADQKEQRAIAALIKASKLPRSKGLENFIFHAGVAISQAKVQRLSNSTSWVKTASNLIIFGASGVGKTHLAAAIGYGLIHKGLKVYFGSAIHLIQELQRAKNELKLEKALQKLDVFDVLIVDDIGYAKKSGTESSVLFELIAHRYEAKSLIITANQPFSQWSDLFPDQIMALAAVDRLIHHCDIIQLQGKSYRATAAQERLSNLEGS
jgi:DNA replication protein DnaC